MIPANISPKSPHEAQRKVISEAEKLSSKLSGIVTKALIEKASTEECRAYIFDRVAILDPQELSPAVRIINELMNEKLLGAQPLEMQELLIAKVQRGLDITEILEEAVFEEVRMINLYGESTDIDFAACLGYQEVVDYLLPLRGDRAFASALLHAIIAGKADLADYLLAKDEWKNYQLESLLSHLVEETDQGHVDKLVFFLLERNVGVQNIARTALYIGESRDFFTAQECIFCSLKREESARFYSQADWVHLFRFSLEIRDYSFIEKMLIDRNVRIDVREGDVYLEEKPLKKEFGLAIYPLVFRDEICRRFGSLTHAVALLDYLPYYFGRELKEPSYVNLLPDSKEQIEYLMGVYGCTTLGALYAKEEARDFIPENHQLEIRKIERAAMWPPVDAEDRREPLPISTLRGWLPKEGFADEEIFITSFIDLLMDSEKTLSGMPHDREKWKAEYRRDLGEIIAVLNEDRDNSRQLTLVADLFACKDYCTRAYNDVRIKWQDALFKRIDQTGKGAFYEGLRELVTKALDHAVEVLKNAHYRDQLIGMQNHLPNGIAHYYEELVPLTSRLDEDPLYKVNGYDAPVINQAFFTKFSPNKIIALAEEVNRANKYEHTFTDWALSKVPKMFINDRVRTLINEFEKYHQNNVYDALMTQNVIMLDGESPEQAFKRVHLTHLMLENESTTSDWYSIEEFLAKEDWFPERASSGFLKRLKNLGITVSPRDTVEIALQRAARAKHALEELKKSPEQAVETYKDLLPPNSAADKRSPKKSRIPTAQSVAELKEFFQDVLDGRANIIPERIPAPDEKITSLRKLALREYITSMNANESAVHPKLHEFWTKYDTYYSIPKRFEKIFAYSDIEESLKEAGYQRQKGETIGMLISRIQKEEYAEEYRDDSTCLATTAAIINLLFEEGIFDGPDRIELFLPTDKEQEVILEHLAKPENLTKVELMRKLKDAIIRDWNRL